ncbi:cyclic-phosphate processing receiver domain-containing protein [Lignipirellula cremea]|uniref:Response regulator receiver domain protein n=1 Tax=Lignipirellula cremea TaxID=2528010 RepID=A0A518E3Y5_9BACT|nr:cyclic-phosphate processing receiver domain-containing protein [Lignipirellula cremea]QDU96244.1 Response regulator receiver domain protein [Lignipirellula cremea]QDU98782.1 Response regulator receiver domain protein [Lignipirellula cremea]
MRITILDDEPCRLEAMQAVLDRLEDPPNVFTFDNAPDMIEWLKDHSASCDLICLDHDLGPNRTRDGTDFDPGIGRDVADFLAKCKPVCPIVIHTTNTEARPGMIAVLEEAGWQVAYVSPYEDLLWVCEIWASEVRQRLGDRAAG